IGKEIVARLARAGYDVAINYKADRAAAESLVAILSAAGGRAFAVCADVSNSQEVDAMFAAVLEKFGKLDALVNNAAGQARKPLLEVDASECDRVISTNLRGCYLCTQRAALYMKARGAGAIVNIGSGCNKVPFPNLSSYTASKGAIEMFTKAAALELG